MKYRVTEVRTAIVTLNPENYPEGWSEENMLEYEKDQAVGTIEYMDIIGADSKFTFQRIINEDS